MLESKGEEITELKVENRKLNESVQTLVRETQALQLTVGKLEGELGEAVQRIGKMVGTIKELLAPHQLCRKKLVTGQIAYAFLERVCSFVESDTTQPSVADIYNSLEDPSGLEQLFTTYNLVDNEIDEVLHNQIQPVSPCPANPYGRNLSWPSHYR
jgi:hypothetical protein